MPVEPVDPTFLELPGAAFVVEEVNGKHRLGKFPLLCGAPAGHGRTLS